MIVVDTNLLVYYYVDSPSTEEVRRVRLRDPEWVAPPLWRSEFLNVMWQYVRQGVFSEEDALRRFREAERVVQIEGPPPAERVLRLAVQHDVTAYDATYTALARRQRDARPTRRHRLPPPADGVAEVRAGLVLIVNGEWIIVNGE